MPAWRVCGVKVGAADRDAADSAEMAVAGYLGYDDTIHLRRLMWSWPILKGAVIFETTLKGQHLANAASILEDVWWPIGEVV
ncbi:hypothetical protein V492_07969 [Pseudogymnoascus sp. VKM F-4246]|nr:hypothetical protein V492_07969 [Pseudogymnoascus sp. VKM F-4246]